MIWQRVVSHALSHVGYDIATRTLEIRFNTGRMVRYLGVPRAVYATLIGSDLVAPIFFALVHDRYPVVAMAPSTQVN